MVKRKEEEKKERKKRTGGYLYAASLVNCLEFQVTFSWQCRSMNWVLPTALPVIDNISIHLATLPHLRDSLVLFFL